MMNCLFPALRNATILGAFLFLATPATATAQSHLSQADAQTYRKAFYALDKDRPEEAMAHAKKASDKTLAKVVRAVVMGEPGNSYSFGDIAAFMETNPAWPTMNDLRRMAEQKMPADMSPQQTLNWFSAHPPLTLAGFYRQTDAMLATKPTDVAINFIRLRWINGDFSRDELAAFHDRFASYLRPADHWARLNRLLWDDKKDSARAMYVYVDSGHKALAEARLQLADENCAADSVTSRVPADLRNDAGLIFGRLRWARVNDRDTEALRILRNPPQNLGNPEAWWTERHIMIRRMIEKGDFKTAYDLALYHGQVDGHGLLQAEFMAGWLALRFLNRPTEAKIYFEKLYHDAATPISKSRGAYWLARAYEALKNSQQARQWYETAATANTYFYGQLAAAQINPGAPLILSEPAIPQQMRDRFWQRDMVKAAWQLRQIGEDRRMKQFLDALADAASDRADFILLTGFAQHIRRADLAVEYAKKANQKGFILPVGGYPLLGLKLPAQPESALIHALTRQESVFRADAISPVGARGLMQLMPSTARELAKKTGLRHKDAKLFEADYNIRLGSAYLAERLDAYNGSLILTIASYNAGQGRVGKWISQFGDPRSGKIDPLDWIEIIPVYETRNYVQRVLEGLQVYRARLNGNRAPLKIQQDTRR